MIKLTDGRTKLYQWDTGRTLTVPVDCSQIHYSNDALGRCSIDVPVTDGEAIIPDILLQTNRPLHVWAFAGTSENGYTKISKVFTVVRRNKPADYVFTPSEQTTLGEILERLDDIESAQDPGAIKNAVDDYLANHPIKVNETDPTVSDWAKENEKPKYTADEVGALSKTELSGAVNDALAQAKESGEFNGSPGAPGLDYVLTEDDKIEIAEMAAELVEVPDSGSNVDLTGYATEQFVRDGYQPKGNYLTEVPEGYAKTEDIPTKPEDIGALPDTYTPPNQTAEQVGADPKGTAATAVSQHNTADDSHNDIRLELKAINDRLTAFFDSDDQTLDELSEIVAYITSNKTLIESITTSKVSVSDIIDNLTTNVTNKPLSAAQGVVLKSLIDTLSGSLANYQPKGDYALRSEIPTVPTKVSAFTNDAGYLTEHQDISGKLDSSALPMAINTALAQAKDSGDFDGANGKDGTSVAHSWNGTTLNVTSASGSSSADLKGAKGDKGDKGDTGEQGPKGDTGEQGPAGSDATVTVANIESALGYHPANQSDVTNLSEEIAELKSKGIVIVQNGNTLTFSNGGEE